MTLALFFNLDFIPTPRKSGPAAAPTPVTSRALPPPGAATAAHGAFYVQQREVLRQMGRGSFALQTTVRAPLTRLRPKKVPLLWIVAIRRRSLTLHLSRGSGGAVIF